MDWISRAERTSLSQRDLRGLVPLVPVDPVPELRRAVSARAGERFPQLLLSALAAGRSVDAAILEDGLALLPDAGVMATAAGHCTGDAVRPLLAAVERGRLGWDLEGVALLLAAFVGRRMGEVDPPELLLEARKLARKAPGGLADSALVGLLALVDDPALEAALGPGVSEELREDARELAEGLAACLLGEPLVCVPETAGSRHTTDQPVRRASEKVGRNAKCPCGSGKKYKQCHLESDRARDADASEVAGVTRTELMAQPEAHLSVDRLDRMLAWELARLNPAEIAPEHRAHWLQRVCFYRDYAVLERAYAVFSDPDLDELLATHAADAAWNGQVEAARGLLAQAQEAVDLPIWALVALADTPDEAVLRIEQHLGQDVDGLPIEAAYALLRSPWPHLGVWFCRAVVPWAAPEDAEPLIGELQDTRERLGHAPWDPVEELLYTLQHGHDPDTARALQDAQEALRSNEVRLQGTTAELAALRDALHAKQAERQPEPTLRGEAPQYVPDPAADALRQRIQALKTELKQRHEERNALRRELRRAREVPVAPAPQPPTEPAEDDPDFEEAEGLEGRLRLPRFSEAFQAALKRVPEATARVAVEKLSAIAVGREGASVGTRRLRGRPWLLRARIGRSYRLLFRMDDDHVEALDLVHRQDLETRIKQLE